MLKLTIKFYKNEAFGRASRLAVTELRLPGYAFGTVADIKKRPLQHSTAMRIVAKVR